MGWVQALERIVVIDGLGTPKRIIVQV